ncbi:MAG: linear amide C-N hydrolase [Deltaproteobacteria bacterium]|nr:MAG: linear amide C-N hydrolase [Deltaproteobacteria bacterium]
MKRFISRLCCLSLILGLAQAPEACTSIRIKTADGLVFYARTMEGAMDFKSQVTIIAKGTAFQGTLPDNTPKGMKWTAKYGVAGMNAYGQPLLTDGINEMGLAVGNLMFPGYAEYQPFEPGQANATLAQYEVATWLLSSFATAAEVRQAMSKVRVVQGPKDVAGIMPLHFCVHDAQGNSLVIEYVKGKLHIYDNPLGVMTNSPAFDWMTTYLCNFVNLSATNVPQLDLKGFTLHQFGQGSGMVGLPGDYSPPSRFVRMVALTQAALPVKGAAAGLNLAMTVINNVDIPKGAVRDQEEKRVMYDITQWAVAADLAAKKYYFHTYANKNWRYVDLPKALKTAKGIQYLPLEVPAAYPEVSVQAK